LQGILSRTAKARANAIANKRLRNAPKLERARALWGDPDYTVDQIAARVGLSRRTLYNALGRRWEDVQHA
jgi:AcrR family transcriptional regulator